MFKCVQALIDAFKYEGIPQALPKQKAVIRSREGGLTGRQVAWCDEKLGNGVFAKAREQAEAARGKA